MTLLQAISTAAAIVIGYAYINRVASAHILGGKRGLRNPKVKDLLIDFALLCATFVAAWAALQ